MDEQGQFQEGNAQRALAQVLPAAAKGVRGPRGRGKAAGSAEEGLPEHLSMFMMLKMIMERALDPVGWRVHQLMGCVGRTCWQLGGAFAFAASPSAVVTCCVFVCGTAHLPMMFTSKHICMPLIPYRVFTPPLPKHTRVAVGHRLLLQPP